MEHILVPMLSAKSLIASKSPGYSQLRGNLKAGWEEMQKCDAASSSQARLQDAYLAGWCAQQRWNLSQQKRSQGMWTFPNLKPGVFMMKKWRSDRLLIKQLWWNPMHPINQTTREVQKLKEWNGHATYTCLQPQFITWKQFSRCSGKSTNEDQMILWMTWTWTWICGACFWIPFFKQQFILDKTMRRIYDSWRITFGIVWDSYSMELENWSVNKQVSLV